jgi:hypothetical protein
MNVHSVHTAQSTHFSGSPIPPAQPSVATGEASQDVATVHAPASAANAALFQNAHTPTGSRVDKHA